MRKVTEFINKTLPYFWAVCWIVTITSASFGLAWTLIKWILNLLGVL